MQNNICRAAFKKKTISAKIASVIVCIIISNKNNCESFSKKMRKMRMFNLILAERALSKRSVHPAEFYAKNNKLSLRMIIEQHGGILFLYI